MKLREKREVLDAAGIERALDQITRQIEANALADLVLVGIHARGVPLAKRLWTRLSAQGTSEIQLGEVDITLYRDDVFEGLPQPIVGETVIPGHSLEGKLVILVDDVLFTGRTIRAALDALMTDFGRPKAVKLAVLVDRGHRELPIAPDYVGVALETSRSETVKVRLAENDGEERVVLLERAE